MIRPRWRALVWFGGVFSALVMISSQARACYGPDYQVEFHWAHHPDFPLDRFAAGRLGLLERTYARSYLVVAYRYLTDRPLSAEEQQGAVDLWQRRLNGPGAYLDLEQESPELDRLPSTWEGTRAKLKNIPLEVPIAKSEPREDGRFHTTIPSDLMGEAARALQEREKQWGATDPRLVQWVQAQDQAFGSTPKAAHIPANLPDQAPKEQHRDRSYQIAVAHYLSGHWDQSEAIFREISKDSASPWRKGAWVMQARIWWRRSETLPPEDREGRKGCLMKAAEILKTHDPDHRWLGLGQQVRFAQRAVSARPKDGGLDWTFKAHCLEKAARAEADPLGRARELAALLERRDGTPDFTLDLGDYTILLDRQIHGEAWESGGADKHRTIPPKLLQDDLTEWVYLFREPSGLAYAKAYDHWQSQGSRAWLLLALMQASPESPGLDALLRAGAEVPWSHPSATTIHYHLARLEATRGQREEAHRRLSAGLDRGAADMSPSAINCYRALRLPLAHNLSEAVADAQRLPVGASWLDGMWEPILRRRWEARYPCDEFGIEHPQTQAFFKGYGRIPMLIEGDGAALLNRELPLNRLIEASELEPLPTYLRDEWQRAAWVKAVLLGRWEEAKRLAQMRVDHKDQLTSSFQAFLSGKDPAREALWILLHYPGLRWYAVEELHWRTYLSKGRESQRPLFLSPEPWNASQMARKASLGGNWWRDISAIRGDWIDKNPPEYDFEWRAPFSDGAPGAGLRHRFALPLAWISEADREAARQEFKAIESQGNGPLWLCKATTAWAAEQPEDRRIPEALHLAVQSAHYADASPFQKQAFQLLHRRYATSPWAAKTPIWN